MLRKNTANMKYAILINAFLALFSNALTIHSHMRSGAYTRRHASMGISCHPRRDSYYHVDPPRRIPYQQERVPFMHPTSKGLEAFKSTEDRVGRIYVRSFHDSSSTATENGLPQNVIVVDFGSSSSKADFAFRQDDGSVVFKKGKEPGDNYHQKITFPIGTKKNFALRGADANSIEEIFNHLVAPYADSSCETAVYGFATGGFRNSDGTPIANAAEIDQLNELIQIKGLQGKVRIISPHEEAEWAYFSTVMANPQFNGILVEIGGKSTQMIWKDDQTDEIETIVSGEVGQQTLRDKVQRNCYSIEHSLQHRDLDDNGRRDNIQKHVDDNENGDLDQRCYDQVVMTYAMSNENGMCRFLDKEYPCLGEEQSVKVASVYMLGTFSLPKNMPITVSLIKKLAYSVCNSKLEMLDEIAPLPADKSAERIKRIQDKGMLCLDLNFFAAFLKESLGVDDDKAVIVEPDLMYKGTKMSNAWSLYPALQAMEGKILDN